MTDESLWKKTNIYLDVQQSEEREHLWLAGGKEARQKGKQYLIGFVLHLTSNRWQIYPIKFQQVSTFEIHNKKQANQYIRFIFFFVKLC